MRYSAFVIVHIVVLFQTFHLFQTTANAAQPNIILFYVDDMGWKDVGFMGSDFYETPNIDSLANAGMIFSSAYANAPNCAPSRACLMSGLYTPRHGIYTVGDPARGNAKYRQLVPIKNKTALENRFVTIANVLQDAGYSTAVMGKWHLGENTKEHGFDLNIGGNKTGGPKGGYFSPYRNPQLADGPKGEFLTDRLTNEAIKFMKQQKEKPFFLYLPHYAVHTPLQAKQNLVEKYKAKQPGKYNSHATYAAMIESVDDSMGRILKFLDDEKMANNTIVWFYSDNGGYGPATSMAPLRGSKGMLYEGGIRVPMAVRWSGKIKAGSKCDTPVIGIDLFPTFLKIANVEPPQSLSLDGQSLLPLLNQTGELKRDAIFWHFPAYLQRYKGVEGPFRTTPAGAMRQGDYKLIEFFEEGRLELYNLKDDISEKKNLAATLPEKTKELHTRLKFWRKQTFAPVPTKKNPKYDPNAVWKPKQKKK